MISSESNFKRLLRPSANFLEDWLTLNPAVWTITDPATGTAWAADITNGSSGRRFVKTVPNASEHARITTIHKYPIGGDSSYIYRKVTSEFIMDLGNTANVAKLDGAQSSFGIWDEPSNGGAAFILDGTNLAIMSGIYTETIGNSRLGGGLWSSWNKFKIEVGYLKTKFWVNDHLVKIALNPYHTDMNEAAIDFDIYTLGTGASTVRIGMARIWSEDEL